MKSGESSSPALNGEALLRLVLAEGEARRKLSSFLHHRALPELLGITQSGAALYSSLRRHGSTGELPGALAVALRTDHAANVAMSLELEATLVELKDAFAKARIEFDVLKGGALLSRGVIADPGARDTCDLDLCTHAADRSRVESLLGSMGFEPIGYGGAPKHLVARRRGRVLIEPHEYAYWTARGEPQGLAALKSEEDPLPFTAVHLAHHLFVTSFVEPWLVHKTLADFKLLAHVFDATPRLQLRTFALARQTGLLREVGALFNVARALSTGSPIAAADNWLVHLATPSPERSRGRAKLEYYARTLIKAPAWYRRDFLAAALLPDASNMEAIHRLEQGSLWVYPAYLLRPLRLMSRAAAHLLVSNKELSRHEP